MAKNRITHLHVDVERHRLDKGWNLKKKNVSYSIEAKDYAHSFTKGHWSSLGPRTEETWYGTHTYRPNGFRIRSAEMTMLHLGESEHLVVRATTATVTCRPQSCCFAQSFPSTSPVSTERSRIDVKNWLSKFSDHSFSSMKKPVAEMNEQLDCRLSPEVLSIVTDPPAINVPTQGKLVAKS